MKKILSLFCFLSCFLHASIYDCFLFYNEYVQLKCRLHELNDVVDYFVLVESVETFQGTPKDLYFSAHQEEFTPYLDRIIYVPLENQEFALGGHPICSAWDRENFQRQQIMRGLSHAKPTDIIIVSDVDEIPRKEVVVDLAKRINPIDEQAFLLSQYGANFFMNRTYGSWNGTIMASKAYFDRYQLFEVRINRHSLIPRENWIPNAGWHFSSLGGLPGWVQKLESFSHVEANRPDYKTEQHLNGEINLRKLVPIDSSFPEYVQNNLKELIAQGYIEPF